MKPRGLSRLSLLVANARRDAFITSTIANGFDFKRAAEDVQAGPAVLKHWQEDRYVLDAIARAVEFKRGAEAITRERILNEVALLAFTRLPDLIDNNGDVNLEALKTDLGTAVAELSITETEDKAGTVTRRRRIKLHPKAQPLEMLMKQQGMLRERVEIEGLSTLAEELKAARERVEIGGPERSKIVAREVKLLDV